jgi:large subunit ribosomal protein L2
MALKQYKPTTPGRRGATSQDFSMITIGTPVKSLTSTRKKNSGRNNQGKITTRHRGGGVKKNYRHINFNPAAGLKATVEHIEYDPNRSARIARLKDEAGKYHYTLAGTDTIQGQNISVGSDAPIETGNRLPLSSIPVGSTIHSIAMKIDGKAQMCRSAGASAQLMAKEEGYALLKLPSGEQRRVLLGCYATLGVIGNLQHQNVKYGSAGRRRRMGWRPTVRGVVMNAVDHPHGGGDGGRHGPGRPPTTPWGVPTLGYKTRKNKRTQKYIAKSRHEGKRKK